MTAVRVRLHEQADARLRHEVHRRRSTVPGLLADLAHEAAAFLPEPKARPRRPLALVLQQRVDAHLADGRTLDEIAALLGLPLERVQRAAEDLEQSDPFGGVS